ncbi:MAG: hypothetical protein VX204_00395 [Candidatus Thermoplasmatota archaeon]|nr:hypothetical protein [Candidatus Thermoplasmatota archaeon]
MTDATVRLVGFGRPQGDDAPSEVLSQAAQGGASIKLVTDSHGSGLGQIDQGAIDWREYLEGTHWLIISASTSLAGDSARSAWGASMAFAELEGSKTVMIMDMPESPERLAEVWGNTIERIRQVHVLFICSDALANISSLEGVTEQNLLLEVRQRGLIPHVCGFIEPNLLQVEHSLGSAKVRVDPSVSHLSWLARFLCELPSSGPGSDGVKSAAEAAGIRD